jgi:hypothetical protein
MAGDRNKEAPIGNRRNIKKNAELKLLVRDVIYSGIQSARKEERETREWLKDALEMRK